jgi:rod shape-determining protein MreC
MRRVIYFFIISIVFGFLFLIPHTNVDRAREFFIFLVQRPLKVFNSAKALTKTDLLEDLRLENYRLKEQIQFLQKQLELGEVVAEKKSDLQRLSDSNDWVKRRKAEIFQQLQMYSRGVVARVIFRETAFWRSCFWINVGTETNGDGDPITIGINSPVVVGTHVVGIVDYVGKKTARVRCITDSGVVPSVRIVRGGENMKTFLLQIQKLLARITVVDFLGKETLQKELLKVLQMQEKEETLYLAKGELQGCVQGSCQFYCRSRRPLLQGVGFNYDFADEEGAGRNLTPDLVKKGDLLITTGFDGVFPAGLEVAYVTKIYPLQEGAVAYDLEAMALIDNFDALSFVTILPPIN